MALKTNYKDAAWSGARQYTIQNYGSYSTITDRTNYTTVGDQFGAKDINETNAAINRLNHTMEITLPSNGWSGSSAPYTYTLNVHSFTSDMEAILVSAMPVGSSASYAAQYREAFAAVCAGSAQINNGSVTFYVYEKPKINITVGLKGV